MLTSLLAASLSCAQKEAVGETEAFQWQTEQFADLRILRYQVPGFDELTLQEKELLYYLYEAALAGRDLRCKG